MSNIDALDFCGTEVVGIDPDDGFARLNINSLFLFTLAPPPEFDVELKQSPWHRHKATH